MVEFPASPGPSINREDHAVSEQKSIAMQFAQILAILEILDNLNIELKEIFQSYHAGMAALRGHSTLDHSDSTPN